jgi:hypothetical protein
VGTERAFSAPHDRLTGIFDRERGRLALAPRRKVRAAFSRLVLAMLLAALDSTIVSTALPTIAEELVPNARSTPTDSSIVRRSV